MTKRAVAWLLTALLAMMMVPSVAFAKADSAGGEGLTAAGAALQTQDDEAVFTIYQKTPVSYASDGTPQYKTTVQKALTQTDLEDLAKKNTDKLGYLYSGKSGVTVVGTNSYVTIDQLLNTYKYAVNTTDEIHFIESVGEDGTINEYARHTASYDELTADNKFFKNHMAAEKDASDPVDAPAVITLSYVKEGLTATKSAGDTLEAMNFDNAEADFMYCVGETQEYYESDGLLPGSYFGNGLKGMVVYSEPTFDVYAKSASASGDGELVKSYTWSQMLSMATDDKDGLAINYNGASVAVTTSYVSVKDLLKNAGVAFNSGDSVAVSDITGFGESNSYAYDKLYSTTDSLKYFPNATASELSTDDAEAVDTVIGLNYQTATAAAPNTADSAVAKILAAGELNVGYRFFIGATESEYTGGSNKGNRLVTNPNKIVVTQGSVEDATVKVASKKYTGKKLTFTPTVTMPDGTKLTAGTDFTVTGNTATKGGSHTMTITGKGSYAGTTKAAYQVTPAANGVTPTTKTYSAAKLAKKAKSFTVKAKSGSATFTAAKDKKGKVSITKAGKVTVKAGTGKGTYTVKTKVTAKGNANYAALSKKAVTIKVTVTK